MDGDFKTLDETETAINMWYGESGIYLEYILPNMPEILEQILCSWKKQLD